MSIIIVYKLYLLTQKQYYLHIQSQKNALSSQNILTQKPCKQKSMEKLIIDIHTQFLIIRIPVVDLFITIYKRTKNN